MATDSVSSSSGTVTSVGTDYNFQGIIDQFADLEKKSLVPFQQAKDDTAAKISAFATLTSAVSGVQTAAATLAKANGDVTTTVTGKGFTATAVSGTAAATYKIEVQQLASAQTLQSGAQASRTNTNGSGGSVAITLANGKTVNVDVSKDTSLNGVAKALNAANAGVQASVVSDGAGKSYLQITSTDSGTKNAISKIDLGGSNSALQAIMGFDAAGGVSALTEETAAVDAKLKVNGIDVVSSSNKVTDVIDGVTLNLTETVPAGTTATLALARNDASISSAADGFITAYNAMQNTIATLTAFDVSTNTNAYLTGDGTTRGVQTGLAAALTSATGTGSLKALAQLGFTTDPKTGTLSIDKDMFNKALNADPASVSALFSGPNGLGATFDAATKRLLGDGTRVKGTIQASTEALAATAKVQQKSYDEASTRVDANIDLLNAQFQALGVAMSAIEQTQKYLTVQFDTMSNSKS